MDECERHSPCEHLCVNHVGNYTCQCYEGYQLYGLTHCAGSYTNLIYRTDGIHYNRGHWPDAFLDGVSDLLGVNSRVGFNVPPNTL